MPTEFTDPAYVPPVVPDDRVAALVLLGIPTYANHAAALAALAEGSVYFDVSLDRVHSVSLDTYYSS